MTKAKSKTKNQNNENGFQYVEYGISVEKRRVMIDEEVDEFSMGWVIRAIQLMIEQNDKDPIEIYINSFGGCCYAGLALYDLLRAAKCPIKTFCIGKAMSMSLILFLAGDERYTFPNSTYMVHSVSSGSFGKVKEMEIDLKETKRLNNILLDILGERTKKNKKWWSKEIEHDDKYYDKVKAKTLGIVNK